MESNENKETQNRYTVSLVYTRNVPNGIETALKVIVFGASSRAEALGKAIHHYTEEMSGYVLANHVTREII